MHSIHIFRRKQGVVCPRPSKAGWNSPSWSSYRLRRGHAPNWSSSIRNTSAYSGPKWYRSDCNRRDQAVSGPTNTPKSWAASDGKWFRRFQIRWSKPRRHTNLAWLKIFPTTPRNVPRSDSRKSHPLYLRIVNWGSLEWKHGSLHHSFSRAKVCRGYHRKFVKFI